MSRLRIGAVGYLNARPLVEGLADDVERFDVRFDVPSECARLLHGAQVDIGLIPAIEYLQGDYVIAPGMAIASEGEVASVALFTRVPIERVATVALDTSSRTSAALTRVLCRERFGITPTFVPHGPDLAQMLEVCDAALLIGDPALDADAARAGAEKIDLGAAWTAHTGLPFVWAVWAGRRAALAPPVVQALAEAKARGLAARDAIADAAAEGDSVRAERNRSYLRHNIHYDLGTRHTEALARFYRAAEAAGVVARAAEPRFVELPDAAGVHAI